MSARAPDPEAARIARELSMKGLRTTALLPVSPSAAVAAAAQALGREVAQGADGQVVIVEASGKSLGRKQSPERLEAVPSCVVGRWLGPTLVVVAPAEQPAPGQVVRSITSLVERVAARSSHVFVDLSGLADPAEALGVARRADGVCLVGQAGSTRERELANLAAELDPEKFLGVLLISD